MWLFHAMILKFMNLCLFVADFILHESFCYFQAVIRLELHWSEDWRIRRMQSNNKKTTWLYLTRSVCVCACVCVCIVNAWMFKEKLRYCSQIDESHNNGSSAAFFSDSCQFVVVQFFSFVHSTFDVVLLNQRSHLHICIHMYNMILLCACNRLLYLTAWIHYGLFGFV